VPGLEQRTWLCQYGLTDDVRAKFGSTFAQVLATDLTPLTFEFAMNGRTGDKINAANLYIELGSGRAGALMPPGRTA